MKQLTIQQFFKFFKNDDACLEHVMAVRYGLKGKCPKCAEETKFSRVSSQRAYACQWCGWHTYPCVGTPFEDSRTSLQLWFYAIYLFTQTRSGVSAKELQRQLGVTYKCAWRIGHEIRKHMGSIGGDPKLSGNVEVDEAYFGGYRKGGQGGKGKTVMLGILERGGNVKTKVIKNRKWLSLIPPISESVEKGSTIHTDEYMIYNSLDKLGKAYKHEAVNHSQEEYARGNSHVNTLEGYWSRLKNSINGTHVHVSAKHLDKYAGEFAYRFNRRLRPYLMLPELLGTYNH
jgi:transposase